MFNIHLLFSFFFFYKQKKTSWETIDLNVQRSTFLEKGSTKFIFDWMEAKSVFKAVWGLEKF